MKKEKPNPQTEKQVILNDIINPDNESLNILNQIQRSIKTVNPLTMSVLSNPPGTVSEPEQKTSSQLNKEINYPISSIGLLKSDFGSGIILFGTATLISQNCILTCAHLLYNPILKKQIITATFYLDLHNGIPLRECQVENFTYPDEFEPEGKKNYDYAICVLQSPLGNIGGFMGIAPYDEKENKKGFFFGYSNPKKEGDKNALSNPSKIEDYIMMGNEVEVRYDSENEFLLYVGVNTFNGQDGSSLFKIKKNELKNGENVPQYDVQIFGIDCSQTRMFLNLKKNPEINNSVARKIYQSNNEIFYHRFNRALPITFKRYQQILRWMNFFLSVVPTVQNSNENEDNNSLKMSNSELVGKDMTMLFNSYDLSLITNLDLSNNAINFEGIKQLVKCKEICRSLIKLNLKDNYIDEKACKFLSEGTFDQLTYLNLANNQLEPEGIKALSLEGDFSAVDELDLSDNHLLNLGVHYLVNGTFKNVLVLYLNHNKIDDEGAYNLSKGNMLQLSRLHLKSNKIGNDGLLLLSKYNLKKLTYLNIEWNNITPSAIYYLGGNNFSKIISINIANNKLGLEGAMLLSAKTIFNLKEINIASNDICTKGAEMIGNLNLTNLEKLDISDNLICDMGVYYLSTGNLTKLKFLNLSLNQITENGIEYLSNAVFSDTLRELNIEGNLVKDNGINFLCLGKMKHLTSLNIGINQLTSNSGSNILKGQFMYLNSLKLQRNEFLAEGVYHLMNARFISELVELDLTYNAIGDEACEFLASAGLRNLKILSLKDNNISDDGVKHLSKGSFNELIDLNLEDNLITKNGIDALSNGFIRKLKYLRLKGNRLFSEDVQSLKKGNLQSLEKDGGFTLVNFSQINTSVIRYFLNLENKENKQIESLKNSSNYLNINGVT